MIPYFDSGIITKWYVAEPDSAKALALGEAYRPPFALTHLHRIELTTAWHLKVFRKEMQLEQLVQALDDLQADADEGFWMRPDYDLIAVYERAERLAKQHAAVLGTRTLDILHVAGAIALRAGELVTADRRQADLARAAGIKVVML